MEKNQPNDLLPRPARRRLWTIILMLGIFVCGMVVGSGLTLKVIYDRVEDVRHNPSKTAERITRRMTWRLDLSHEQSARVKEILNRNLNALDSVKGQVRSQLVQQMVQTRQEISDVLTPEQARKLNKRFKQIEAFWMPPASR